MLFVRPMIHTVEDHHPHTPPLPLPQDTSAHIQSFLDIDSLCTWAITHRTVHITRTQLRTAILSDTRFVSRAESRVLREWIAWGECDTCQYKPRVANGTEEVGVHPTERRFEGQVHAQPCLKQCPEMWVQAQPAYAPNFHYAESGSANKPRLSIQITPDDVHCCVDTTLSHPTTGLFTTVLPRGVCYVDTQNQTLLWQDLWADTKHVFRCPFLNQMPPFHMSRPSAPLWTAAAPPCGLQEYLRTSIVAVVGTPEDTVCQTNYRRLYRIQNGQPPTEIAVGGAFESVVTRMQVVHICGPFLVVVAYPAAVGSGTTTTGRLWKHFGVWNLHARQPTLCHCHPDQETQQDDADDTNLVFAVKRRLLGAVAPWVHLLRKAGWMRCEQVCADTNTGDTLYWTTTTDRGTLHTLNLQTHTTRVFRNYKALTERNVGRLTVCRLWEVIGVYDKSECTWYVYDLPTGNTLIHCFADQRFQQTTLVFLPHQGICRFTREGSNVTDPPTVVHTTVRVQFHVDRSV